MPQLKKASWKSIIPVVLGLTVSTLISCALPIDKTKKDSTAANQQAEEFYQTGDFAAAAQAYLALAEIDPANAAKHQLNAANALIKDQQAEPARKILELLEQEQLNAIQIGAREISLAQILLAEGDIEQAAGKINLGLPPESPRSLLIEFYSTRARIFNLQKRYLAEAGDRILINAYLDTTEKISDNHQRLWRALMNMPRTQLDISSTDANGILKSWLEIALIAKNTLHDTVELANAVADWQQRYPGHPALNKIIPDLIGDSERLTALPKKIGLLLPLEGAYGKHAKAIREGFIAAWYKSKEYKPDIKIYPTNIEDIIAIYEQAIADGIDFFVGPLQKATISRLLENRDINVRTLLLNKYEETQTAIENTATPDFIQFYISPEEEAEQVADYAWFQGHARAAVIGNENKISQRINDSFSRHWRMLGGEIITYVNIARNTNDFKESAGKVFSIEQSRERIKLLGNILNREIKASVRRRQDIDMLFMALPPDIARRLVPELRRYGIEDIALYSTSYIYTGTINARKDNDINRVIFTDMPWLIEPEYRYSSLNRALDRHHQPSQTGYQRLYALGIDAYEIIPRLAELISQPDARYQGKTGILKFNPDKRINRRLIWSQFIDGEPKPHDNASLN